MTDKESNHEIEGEGEGEGDPKSQLQPPAWHQLNFLLALPLSLSLSPVTMGSKIKGSLAKEWFSAYQQPCTEERKETSDLKINYPHRHHRQFFS